MKKKDIMDLSDGDELFCAPHDYLELPDFSDDYEVSAKIMTIEKPSIICKIRNALVGKQPVYGPVTSYKGHYGYNGDD